MIYVQDILEYEGNIYAVLSKTCYILFGLLNYITVYKENISMIELFNASLH